MSGFIVLFLLTKSREKKTFHSSRDCNVITKCRATAVELKPKRAHRCVKEESRTFFRFFFWQEFSRFHSKSYCMIWDVPFGPWRSQKTPDIYFGGKLDRCVNLGFSVNLKKKVRYLTSGLAYTGSGGAKNYLTRFQFK